MTTVYTISIDSPVDEETYAKLLRCVSAEKRQRIGKFRSHEDCKRSLYGELMARNAAHAQLGIDNSAIRFAAGPGGKPYLPGAPAFHFNISHSGNWAVCAVSGDEVGIDIEKISEADLRIARRFFSQDEAEALARAAQAVRNTFFFTLWTLKESYIKYLGEGLSCPLNSFSMRVDGDTASLAAAAQPSPYFRTCRFSQDYCLSLCTQKPVGALRCASCSPAQLADALQVAE